MDNPQVRADDEELHRIYEHAQDMWSTYKLLHHHLTVHLPPSHLYKGRLLVGKTPMPHAKKLQKQGDHVYPANVYRLKNGRVVIDQNNPQGKWGKDRPNDVVKRLGERIGTCCELTSKSARKLGATKVADSNASTRHKHAKSRHQIGGTGGNANGTKTHALYEENTMESQTRIHEALRVKEWILAKRAARDRGENIENYGPDQFNKQPGASSVAAPSVAAPSEATKPSPKKRKKASSRSAVDLTESP